MTEDESIQPVDTPWWLILIEGVAAIIVGLLLFASLTGSTVIIVQLLGIYWLIAGVVSLVSIFLDSEGWGWKLLNGIIGVLIGFLIVQHPLWSALLVPATAVLLLGFAGLVMGTVKLIQAFRGGGWGMGILGVISIGFGFVIVANPLLGAISLSFALGLIGVVGGTVAVIIAVIQALRLR